MIAPTPRKRLHEEPAVRLTQPSHAQAVSESKPAHVYLYRPLYRPASFATVPAGWSYVEVPSSVAKGRPDLPVSRYPHGVISYERPLTDSECERFELEAL